MKRKGLKTVGIVFLAIIAVAVCYVLYVLIDYHRLDDNLQLAVTKGTTATMPADGEYSVISYNIGFGAYTADYSFFMDGGKESRARSENAVYEDIGNITSFLKEQNADFMLIEEVDTNSTRSYHVDEQVIIQDAFSSYDKVFAQNYDSPYLFYPLTCPHGKSVSGILCLSRYNITSGLRRSLPIDDSLKKLLDLDRCYSVSRVPLKNGKELVLFTFHLSAYASDGSFSTAQLQMLVSDMQSEYEKGNYVIAGGDFNKDLLGRSEQYFGVKDPGYSWSEPIPAALFDTVNLSLVAPLDIENPVPSCRNPDSAYHKGQFVLTIDGFIVSDNITVLSSEVLDTGFAWSDHNPVRMRFTLN